jgi:putative DNA primase/helicase
VADADWTPEEAKNYLKSAMQEVPVIAKQQARASVPAPVSIPGQASQAPPDSPSVETMPFRPLGYHTEEFKIYYWFLEHATESILCFPSRNLEQSHSFKELAPANYWEAHFPARNGINAQAVGEMLRMQCRFAGYFDTTKIRGRGAWMDDGRLVVHCGDALLVDGEKTKLIDLESEFAYQKKRPIPMPSGDQMSDDDAKKLFQVCSLFAWERKVDPWLMAGWIALAPVCGALNWRPHVWVTGGAGTGKSWILQRVVRPMLAASHIAVQSKTTEPAIRQMIDSDGLPVVYDEFEAENEREMERVQAILDLARSASSADGGSITKGGKNGTAKQYLIRSAFMFASIANSLEQYSDKSRITM